jgi:hypothetical protein
VLAGYRLRNGCWLTEFSLQTLGYEAPQRLLDWVLGALCMAPLFGLAAGCVTWGLVFLAARGILVNEGQRT